MVARLSFPLQKSATCCTVHWVPVRASSTALTIDESDFKPVLVMARAGKRWSLRLKTASGRGAES